MMRALTAFVRPPAAHAKPDNAWEQLKEAGEFERHFNQLQANYRTLASTWLLATFAGIGFVIVNAKTIQGMAIDSFLMAAGISFAGAVGIALIWNLDLLVYHRLLDAIFNTARYIEEYHPELPPFRTNMMGVTKSGGVLRHVVWFYIVGVDLLLVVGATALSLEFAQHNLPWIAATAGGLLLLVVVTRLMRSMTKRYRNAIKVFFHITDETTPGSMQRWSQSSGTWRTPPT